VKKIELAVQRHEVRIAADSPMRLESKFLTFRIDQHDSDDLKPFSPLMHFRLTRVPKALYSVLSKLIW
jgi:hypothetical protein